jgi:hypothetical protein
MLNNAQLLRKIHDAGKLYHEIFGSFPKKVGIYYPRWKQLDCWQTFFIEIPKLDITCFSNDLDDAPSISQHLADIDPITANGLDWDGVYLPHPYYPDRVMESAQLEELAMRRRNPCNS